MHFGGWNDDEDEAVIGLTRSSAAPDVATGGDTVGLTEGGDNQSYRPRSGSGAVVSAKRPPKPLSLSALGNAGGSNGLPAKAPTTILSTETSVRMPTPPPPVYVQPASAAEYVHRGIPTIATTGDSHASTVTRPDQQQPPPVSQADDLVAYLQARGGIGGAARPHHPQMWSQSHAASHGSFGRRDQTPPARPQAGMTLDALNENGQSSDAAAGGVAPRGGVGASRVRVPIHIIQRERAKRESGGLRPQREYGYQEDAVAKGGGAGGGVSVARAFSSQYGGAGGGMRTTTATTTPPRRSALYASAPKPQKPVWNDRVATAPTAARERSALAGVDRATAAARRRIGQRLGGGSTQGQHSYATAAAAAAAGSGSTPERSASAPVVKRQPFQLSAAPVTSRFTRSASTGPAARAASTGSRLPPIHRRQFLATGPPQGGSGKDAALVPRTTHSLVGDALTAHEGQGQNSARRYAAIVSPGGGDAAGRGASPGKKSVKLRLPEDDEAAALAASPECAALHELLAEERLRTTAARLTAEDLREGLVRARASSALLRKHVTTASRSTDPEVRRAARMQRMVVEAGQERARIEREGKQKDARLRELRKMLSALEARGAPSSAETAAAVVHDLQGGVSGTPDRPPLPGALSSRLPPVAEPISPEASRAPHPPGGTASRREGSMPGPSSSANSPSRHQQHHHDAAADAAAATKIEATAVIASANAARERVQRLQRYRENLAATVDRKERALSASTGVLRKERERKQLQERRARLAELDDLRRRLHNEVEQAVAAVRGDHDRVLRHRRRQLDAKLAEEQQKAGEMLSRLAETGTTGTQQTKALADARIMCVRVENQLAADQAVLQEVRTALASAQTAIASKDSELRQLQAALRAKQQELRVATEINERERQRAADDQARTFREKTEIVARLVGDETAVLRQVDAVRAERQKLEQQLRAAEASSAAAAADASRLREAAAALEADAARQRAAADAAAGAAVDAAKQRQKAATDRLAAARKAAAAVEARDAEIQRLTQAVEKAKHDAAARNTDEMALLERLDRIERLLALST